MHSKLTKEALDAGLSAHAEWKPRLLDAIATGRSEIRPDFAATDNQCDFGKWLHAEFHIQTGEILKLALSGRKEEAMKKLEVVDGYVILSGKFVQAMKDWRSKL